MNLIKIINPFNLFNRNSIIGKLFGAHSPNGDTEILKREENFGVKYAIVIRKTWLYCLAQSGYIILNLGILILNIIILMYHNNSVSGNTLVIGILIFNVLYGAIIYFKYLFSYRSLNINIPKVDAIYKWIQRAEKQDKLYNNFFNQTVSNILLFVVVFLYVFTMTVLNFNGLGFDDFWIFINILLFITQIYVLWKLKMAINNQEMDFVIVTSNKLYLYDQVSYTQNNQNDFPVEKIINMKGIYGNNENTGSFLGSLFKYGTLMFFLDGGDERTATSFQFTPFIEETKTQVLQFIEKAEIVNGEMEYKYKQITKTIPVILNQILFLLKIDIDKNINSIQNNGAYHKEIKEFLIKNREFLLKEYQNGSIDIKNEIQELGKKYLYI